MIEKRQFYINGKWINSVDGRDYKVINPSTEEPVAVISLGGQADTNASVAAAKAAFPAWMATSIDERLAILENLVEIYKTRMEDLAQAMSLEMGAPIDMARTQQVEAGLGHLKNFIKAAKGLGFVTPLGDHAPNEECQPAHQGHQGYDLGGQIGGGEGS